MLTYEMLTYDLKMRARMCLWVTLLCGATTAMMQLFLAGTGEIQNYAERQLDDAVQDDAVQDAVQLVLCAKRHQGCRRGPDAVIQRRARVHQEVTDLSRTETHR